MVGREAADAIEDAAHRAAHGDNALEGGGAIELFGQRERLLGRMTDAFIFISQYEADAYVAGFQLLNAMGQAEADDLGLDGGPLYDPLGNYRAVAGNWNDWAGDPKHEPVATRTVTPAEEAPLPPAPVKR